MKIMQKAMQVSVSVAAGRNARKLRIALARNSAEVEREATELHNQLNHIADEIRNQTDAVHQIESEHGERTQRGMALMDCARIATASTRLRSKSTAKRASPHERRAGVRNWWCGLECRRQNPAQNSAPYVHRRGVRGHRQVLERAADLAVAQNDLAWATRSRSCYSRATASKPNRKPIGPRRWRAWPPSCLHNQLVKAKSASQGLIEQARGSKLKFHQQNRTRTPSADNVGSLRWNSKQSRSASAAFRMGFFAFRTRGPEAPRRNWRKTHLMNSGRVRSALGKKGSLKP